MVGTGVILSKEQLKTLAKLIQWQEQERIKTIRFRSEKDRSEYLKCSRETYEKTVELLDETIEGSKNINFEEHDPAKDASDKFLAYLEIGAAFGMQALKSLHLRNDFLTKVRAHADELIPRLEELFNGSLQPYQIEMRSRALVEELSGFEDALFKSITLKVDPSSEQFCKAIKLDRYSFEDLVTKYQKKLVREKGPEYDKEFEFLEDEQKIEVYDEIIKAAGRESYLTSTLYKAASKAGKWIMIFTLATVAWDIYSSEHKLQTAVKEGAELGAGYFGSVAGELAGTAAATYLVTTLGVAEGVATAAFVGLASFVTGVGIGIGLGILAGFVVSQIFHSGGKHAGGAITVKKDEPKLALVPHHPYRSQVYASAMPDGALLARQLAYSSAPPAALLASVLVPVPVPISVA